MAVSSKPTTGQIHVSLAEDHRCSAARPSITSGVSVTRPERAFSFRLMLRSREAESELKK